PRRAGRRAAGPARHGRLPRGRSRGRARAGAPHAPHGGGRHGRGEGEDARAREPGRAHRCDQPRGGGVQGALSPGALDLLRAGRARLSYHFDKGVTTIDPVAAQSPGIEKRPASKPDAAAIRAAAARIAPYVRRTPVIEVAGADFGLADVRLVFKLEFLQHAGSFKTRGAFNSLLSRAIPQAGVVAASGGNHGAAVAYAAMRLGVPATIFVPTVSSPAKISRIRDYGAELVVGGDRYADALAASEAWVAQSGALAVHAFDQVHTLLGQATIGLELSAQAPELDTLLVAVGGGGL